MDYQQHILIKKILFGFFILLLIAPVIQNKLKLFNVKPLGGSFIEKQNPDLSLKTWLSNDYQNQEEAYLNEHFGFRNWLVRLDNQMAYSLFNDAKTNGVVVGKDQFLFQQAYIDAYYGTDFIGKDKIVNKISEIKKISDLLHQKNIDLLIVFAPGKASYYPEYIPDHLKRENKQITNYKIYRQEIQKNKLHFIDFKKWFSEMKDNSPYPLFPKTGIHWSSYGELLAADSLIKYIENLRHLKAPKIKINKVFISDTTQYRDDDIEQSMNLIFDIPDLKMAYPSFKIVADSLSVKPKVLVVADSFYWGMFNWGISHHVFDHSQFWFYNNSIYSNDFKTAKNTGEVSIIDETEKNDVIVLFTTDANLKEFPFGFIHDLSEAYEPYSSKNEKAIQEYMNAIRNTPEWLDMIKKQAKEQNIELKKAIRNNAEFMVKQKQ